MVLSVPATVNWPSLHSRSASDASSRWAAIFLPLLTTLSIAFTKAEPPTASERDGVGAHSKWDLAGVAMHDVNQLNRHTELVCDYLRKCRLVALAVAMRAGEHGDASSRVNPHFCRLIETGARPKLTGEHRRCHCTRLNVRRDTDTAQLSLSRRPLPALFEAGIVRRLQRHFERGEIVAAVVDERHRRLIGVGVLGNEIAAAQLCRVDPHLARRRLDE